MNSINYEPNKKSDNKAREEELQNFMFNDVSSTTSSSSQGEKKRNAQNNEIKIFYNFYLTALIFEKTLTVDYLDTQKNFTLLYWLEKAIDNFAMIYFNMNFKLIDEKFRNFYIGKILSSNNHINNIFQILDQLTYYENHIFNVIKVIRVLTDKKIAKLEEEFDVDKLPKLNKVINDKIKLLLDTLIEIEMDRKLIFFLLPMIVNYDKSNKNKTILNIINLKKNKDKFLKKHKSLYKQSDSVLYNDSYFPKEIQNILKEYLTKNKTGKIQEIPEEIASSTKLFTSKTKFLSSKKKSATVLPRGSSSKLEEEKGYGSTFNPNATPETPDDDDEGENQEKKFSVFEKDFNLGLKSIYMGEKYISSLLDNDTFIVMTAFVSFTKILGAPDESYLMNFISTDLDGSKFLIATNTKILMKKFNSDSLEFDDDKPDFELTFEYMKIKSITFHDYTSRLIFKMKDGRIFSILFSSTDEANQFVKKVTNLCQEIQVYSSNNLNKFLNEEIKKLHPRMNFDNDDEEEKEENITETEQIKRKQMEEKERIFIVNKIGNVVNHTKIFNFDTTIYQNFYPKKLDKYIINHKNFFFPNKKNPDKNILIVFSQKNIYILKENLKLIQALEPEEKQMEYIVEEGKCIFEIGKEVPYNAITNIESNFETLTVVLTSEFFSDRFFYEKKPLELELKFEDRFDMFLFNIGISKLNEIAYRNFMRSQEFKQKDDGSQAGKTSAPVGS